MREILAPFGLGIGIFTLILLIARILKLVEMVVNRGVPFTVVVKLFCLILPGFLEVTVPMATLLAVIVAFGRLSSDSEITALKSCGVSLYQMAVPVFVFALPVFAVSVLISLVARPWSNTQLRNTLYEIARSRASAAIKEKIFTTEFEGMVVYVDHIVPPGNSLRGILIADHRDPAQRNTAIAKAGILVPATDTDRLTIRLIDGAVHTFYESDRSYHRTDFSTYDISVDLNTPLGGQSRRERDPNELTWHELQTEIDRLQSVGQPALAERVELHRKLAIPAACLIFALAGIPLGIRPSRAVRSRSLAVSIFLIFLYYLLLTLGETLSQRGALPPVVGMWLPNGILLPTALLLFWRSAAERKLSELFRPSRS